MTGRLIGCLFHYVQTQVLLSEAGEFSGRNCHGYHNNTSAMLRIWDTL